jgi:cellulose synthase/poly-beta-1,6-N-acetylglucosamine synthase-like glycosyltransferase
VVIPTYNRSVYIGPLLASLENAAAQYSGQSEVIVVDSSEPKEAATISDLCRKHGAQFVPGPDSVRKKRNIGIERATSAIVLFVDSDCVGDPDLFVQHARTLTEADSSVAGAVGVTDFVGPDTWMWQTISRTQFLNAFSFARRMDYAPWATCSNTSYWRSVLVDHGRFDESFPFRLGADDADLGIRLNKAGLRLKTNPNAIVSHTRATWNSFLAIWRRAFRWGRMELHLYYRKHADRVRIGVPKLSTVFLGLLLVSLVNALFSLTFRPLLLPVLWAFWVVAFQAAFTVRLSNESWRYWGNEFVADVLGLTFEVGTILEGAKHLEPSVLYKTVQRGPVLPAFSQQEWLVQAWSMWLGLLLTMIIVGVFG